MKSGIYSFSLTVLLLLSGFASADTSLIRTTIADSSRTAFIARIPLSMDSVSHDTLDFVRFSHIPVTDSTGFPELPVVTVLVAVPDSVTPSVDFTVSDMVCRRTIPVYPSPARYVSYAHTAAEVDSFAMDPTAYASDAFWPENRVTLLGETRICHQRFLQLQLYPAQYRASDSILCTVSAFSVSVSFDSSEAVWNSIGLGPFQSMVHGSPVVGYQHTEQSSAPVPDYFGVVDPMNGPQAPNRRMPDYVIICASGLYDDFGEAVDDLAEHRVSLNGFDAATVLTDDILEDFGSGMTEITDEVIREFTEHMWQNWPQASEKPPVYLLLIGDHEDVTYAGEQWYLPTHEFAIDTAPTMAANDEWYAYFNGDPDIESAFPSMMVGRLSVRNGSSLQTDTLSEIVENILALEEPVQQIPLVDNRRRILRLAGTGSDDNSETAVQAYVSWEPDREWTCDLADWMGFDYVTRYCGDGRDFSSSDGSILASHEYRDYVLDELSSGAGVAFYSNHGEYHMLSAGLEYWPRYIPDDNLTKGTRDSTFNNYQLENYLTTPDQYYAAPFILLLCCSAGTFNHTLHEHQNRGSHPYYCRLIESTQVPLYDFGTDCLAEKLLKNTGVPVAGVFCGSRYSLTSYYQYYGEGILQAIYSRGHGRLGEAIQDARFQYEAFFGHGPKELAQFNLLGDPALDISDRVRYPNSCDLVVYQDDLIISEYPVETSSGTILPVNFTIRNFGRQNSGAFIARVTFRRSNNTSSYDINCSSIGTRDSLEVQYDWSCSNWFVPPMDVMVSVTADYQESCSDSWRGNNSATRQVQMNDTYPLDAGWHDPYWPLNPSGIVNTTPILVNLDTDPELEVAALTGTSLTAYEHDGTLKWEYCEENLSGCQPLTVDLDGNGTNEILCSFNGGVRAISNQGSRISDLSLSGTACFCMGEMSSSHSGLELCVASGLDLHLYYWNSLRNEFVEITSKRFSFPENRTPASLCCADMGGSVQDEAIFCMTSNNIATPFNAVVVYDWAASAALFSKSWSTGTNSMHPAAGQLSGTSMIGYPLGSYDPASEVPAELIDSSSFTEQDCEEGTEEAAMLRYGVFADWAAGSGADAFVLPSEMECMAWDLEGSMLTGWPTGEYSGAVFSSAISPTSLGKLNNTTYADVLFSTAGVVYAYNSIGNQLTTPGFPFALPEGVSATGGFAIGDIDRDEKVEIVFGSSDGCLH